MATAFRYWETTQDGETVGLIRMVTDDDAKTLTLQRLEDDAEWKDDSSLIDDLHEAGTREITDPAELRSLKAELLRAQVSNRRAGAPVAPSV